MSAYFVNIKPEERENILNKHREVYNGYQTLNPAPVKNPQDLYVQDLANDKMGMTVNNRGEVMPYTNMGINESKRDFSPMGYAKRILNGELSIEEAMKEAELSFVVLADLIKKLKKSKGAEMEEGEMCEQCQMEEDVEGGDQMDISMMGDSLMGSQDFQRVFQSLDPALYDDEFEYADNVIYNLLYKYQDEPYFEDLVEYIKDVYSEDLFDAYRVTVGDDFFGDNDIEDIDYEEMEEDVDDGEVASDVEPAYDFQSHGPEDVYGTLKDYDKQHPHHDYDSMEDVEKYDPSMDLANMFGDMEDGMAFQDIPTDTFQQDAGDINRMGDEGLGQDTENDMDLQKVDTGYNFVSGGSEGGDVFPNEDDIDEEVDEDLKESFTEQRKLTLEMFKRLSRFN